MSGVATDVSDILGDLPDRIATLISLVNYLNAGQGKATFAARLERDWPELRDAAYRIEEELAQAEAREDDALLRVFKLELEAVDQAEQQRQAEHAAAVEAGCY